MQKFDYRAPRFLVDFHARLTIQDSAQLGRCTEISTEGMRLELRQPHPPDSCGVVSLTYQALTLELRVRVTNAGPTHDGLDFSYDFEEQKNVMNRLISLLTDAQNRPGPALVR